VKNLHQLLLSEKVVDGYENSAGFGAGKIDLKKFGTVVQEGGNPVSLQETQLQQAARKAIDSLIQFTIIHPLVFKDQRRLIRVIKCAPSKDISDTHLDRLLRKPNQHYFIYLRGWGVFSKFSRCMNNRPRNLHKLMPKGS